MNAPATQRQAIDLPRPQDGRLAFIRSADKARHDGDLDCSPRQFKGWVARQLKICPRVAGRWIRTARYVPLPVQHAVDHNQLDITTAERVVVLGRETQEEIADRLERGEDPQTVIHSYLTDKTASAGAVVRRLVVALKKCNKDLNGRCDEIPRLGSEDLATLESAHNLIATIQEQGTKGRRDGSFTKLMAAAKAAKERNHEAVQGS